MVHLMVIGGNIHVSLVKYQERKNEKVTAMEVEVPSSIIATELQARYQSCPEAASPEGWIDLDTSPLPESPRSTPERFAIMPAPMLISPLPPTPTRRIPITPGKEAIAMYRQAKLMEELFGRSPTITPRPKAMELSTPEKPVTPGKDFSLRISIPLWKLRPPTRPTGKMLFRLKTKDQPTKWIKIPPKPMESAWEFSHLEEEWKYVMVNGGNIHVSLVKYQERKNEKGICSYAEKTSKQAHNHLRLILANLVT